MNRPLLIFAVTFLISIVLHVLIVLMIYQPSNFITMPFTGGMLLGWLYASSTVRDFSETEKDINYFKKLFLGLPAILRYSLAFFALYAVLNFFVTMSFQNGGGWVDFNLSHDKLRGISGFWMFFYALGFSAAYLKLKQSIT